MLTLLALSRDRQRVDPRRRGKSLSRAQLEAGPSRSLSLIGVEVEKFAGAGRSRKGLCCHLELRTLLGP
jgi:hypothetical protein